MSKGYIITSIKHGMHPQRAILQNSCNGGSPLYTHPSSTGACPPYPAHTGSCITIQPDQAQYQAPSRGLMNHLCGGNYARICIPIRLVVTFVSSYFREHLLCEVHTKYAGVACNKGVGGGSGHGPRRRGGHGSLVAATRACLTRACVGGDYPLALTCFPSL
jgi:hypothetical protein